MLSAAVDAEGQIAAVNTTQISTEPHGTYAAPRLVMMKMVLHNFKSYANTVEIGPFHKSFTSIVGPNGSGKSNVIDALLFVFGFKAKKLRQGKLSDLIHSSAGYEHIKRAEVEIWFQEIVDLPGDAYKVIEGSQIIVSRVVEKLDKGGDKSTYLVNGKTSSFTQVTTLLKDKGVDLDHKRFLILQGEVESIAQMKPKAPTEHEDGLLEYLEDIIGTSKYKTPIEELGKVVETLSEERAIKLQRVQIVEKEKNGLEGKKSEAVGFIERENLLAVNKNKYYQLCTYECEKIMTDLEEQMATRTKEMEEEKAKYGELSVEINQLTKTCRTIEKEYDEIATTAETVRKELSKYERAEVEFKEKEKHLKQKEKKLNKTVSSDKFAVSETETWMRNFDSDVAKRSKEVEDFIKKLDKEQQVFDEIQESLKDKTATFQHQIEAKQKELAPWMEKVNKLQAELGVSESEYDMLMKRISAGEVKLKDAQQAVSELVILKREKKVELDQVYKRKAELERNISSLSVSIEDLQSKEESAKQIVTASSTKVQEAKSTLANSQSRGNVHRAIMQQSRAGKISGVCGRLGDLGMIDERYDVAITTACGALDNIVVDTVEAGQNCIQFLKQQNLGRATFICLDKLKRYDVSPISTPKNIPRLFDLVQPSESKYSNAFYHVLKDTLVSLDLEEANSIAFGGGSKRFRVITLDGQLIDISGTMSGGGSKPMRGGMLFKKGGKGGKGAAGGGFQSGADVRQEDVVRLESELQEAEAVLRQIVERRRSVELELQREGRMLPAIEIEIGKAEMDTESVDKQIADAEKLVKELETQIQPDESDIQRMSELKSIISTQKSQASKLTDSSSKIENQIKQLQEKILEVGGVRLRMQKAKVDGLQEQVDTCNSSLTKLQVEKATREKSYAKIVKTLEKKVEELRVCTNELDTLSEESRKMKDAAVDIREKVQKAKEILVEKEEEMKQLKGELDEKSQIMNEIRRAEMNVKALQEETKKKLSSYKNASAKYQRELEGLSLQSIGLEDEEELPELEELDEGDFAEMDRKALETSIAQLEAEIKKSTPNLEVLMEYKAKMSEYLSRAADLREITEKREQVKEEYEGMRKKRLDEFLEGFTVISQKLKEMYQMITLGGNAELELVDSLDPFSEGIVFSVMPPKKSWKNISNLSGGEKTLSSLALVFALHHYKPTPLYVMDEIDAALDFRNVSIVANYIKERTKNGQFVIISLRNNMFELADRLVGIYKTNNATKSITINPSVITVS